MQFFLLDIIPLIKLIHANELHNIRINKGKIRYTLSSY